MAAALVAALLGFGGCDRLARQGDAQPAAVGRDAGGPVPVTVVMAAHQDMPLQVQAIGWAEPYQSVQIKSRVDGHLTAIHFAEGQDVKTNSPLFTIDRRAFEAAMHLAEANLARNKALAEDARQDFQWIDGLYKENSATEREHGRAKARLDAALADIQADEASLEQARLNLAYCTIESPIDGRTGDRLVDRGNMIKANDTALVSIEQVSPVFVVFSVAEPHLPKIKQYMAKGELRVEAVIPGEGGPAEAGVLTFLDNKVDTTTGQIRLKGTFKNEGKRLWPGQYVNVTLRLDVRKGQVVIPAQAVQTGQKGPFVFVVKEGNVAEVRPVVPGDVIENRVIIEEGLDAGERVVTDGQLRLVNGAKVDLKGAASCPASAAATEKLAASEGERP